MVKRFVKAGMTLRVVEQKGQGIISENTKLENISKPT